MKTIRVGGVPEHFNLPWHLCIEDGDFEYENLNIQWIDFPGGTGAMNQALRDGEIDVAIILTEGIVKDIVAGNPSFIVQNYIETPLIWGIHVDANAPYMSLEELEHCKVAISRPGSGSQLMAYVNAKKQNWDINKLQFETVGDIDGAIQSLKNDPAQYFMWERFTTKPLVDDGTFKHIDNCPTPWPCFVVAASKAILNSDEHEVKKMLDVVNTKTKSFKEVNNVDQILSKRYHQKIEDIREWLKITEWSQDQITDKEIDEVLEQLFELKLISKKLSHSEIIYNL